MALTPHGLKGRPSNALNKGKDTCPKGHKYTEENTYLYKNRRYCIQCKKERIRQDRINAKERKPALMTWDGEL